MRGQARVLAGQDTALVCDKRTEEVCVLVIKRVEREVDLRLRPRRAALCGTAFALFVRVSLAWHKLLHFPMNCMAAQKRIVLFDLQFLRLQLLVSRGGIARGRLALLARLRAFDSDNFSRHKSVLVSLRFFLWLVFFAPAGFGVRSASTVHRAQSAQTTRAQRAVAFE